jgi:hypothetical protein
MNGGNCFSSAVHTTASCYPLILPAQYHGPHSVRYSYEGEEGRYKGKVFRLGPKTLFTSTDPTLNEWTRMFRVMFADGGMFTHGVTYAEFLMERLPPKTPNERLAHAAELALCQSTRMPETKDETQRFLDEDVCALNPNLHSQLKLTL